VPVTKKLKRLNAAASLQFDGGLNIVSLSTPESEGGEYELHPFSTEGETVDNGTRFYFPTPTAPGYGVAIEGDIETLGRFARAILAAERKGKDSGEDSPAEA
jgi:hypothetical protein